MSVTQLVRTYGDRDSFAHRAFNQIWSADGINDYLSFENNAAVQDLIFNRLGQNNRFTISCWVNPILNTGSNYIFINFNNTNQTLLGGAWNVATPTYTVLYGGISSNTGTQGWQTFRPITGLQNDYVSLTNVGFTNRLCHFAWVNSGSGSNRFRIYVNGRLWTKSEFLATLVNYNQAATNSFITICMTSYNSIAFTFIPLRITDFMISTVAATAHEIRQIFNNGTNIVSEYFTKYPANLLNNRWVHLPLSTGNFSAVGSDLFANDISGNNRNFRVFGQGTTPTLVNAY